MSDREYQSASKHIIQYKLAKWLALLDRASANFALR